MLHLKNPYRLLKHIIVIPIVSTCIIPLSFFDLWVEIYHRICFPLYGIPYVKRGDYIRIDRHKLDYLNIFQKIYCVYCGYANGAIQYWVKIAAETEYYWCGIQHNESDTFIAPAHHRDFIKYGDKDEFKEKYPGK